MSVLDKLVEWIKKEQENVKNAPEEKKDFALFYYYDTILKKINKLKEGGDEA